MNKNYITAPDKTHDYDPLSQDLMALEIFRPSSHFVYSSSLAEARQHVLFKISKDITLSFAWCVTM